MKQTADWNAQLTDRLDKTTTDGHNLEDHFFHEGATIAAVVPCALVR